MNTPHADNPTPLEMLQMAARLFQRGQWRESASICRSLLANGHALFDVFHLLGLSLYQLGRPQEAIEFLERAIERNTQHAQVRNSMGSVYFSMDQFSSAEAQFERAIRLEPTYWEPYQNLINTYIAQNKMQLASELIADAEKQFGETPALLRRKVRVAIKLEENETALSLLDRLIETNKEDVDAINDKALVLARLNQKELAISYLENLTRVQPDYLNSHVNLAYAYYRLGEFNSAEQSFKQALSMLAETRNANPQSELLKNKIAFLLSTIYLLRGDYKRGWKNYRHRPSILLREKKTDFNISGGFTGKRVLVERDQGLGDELFFLRFCQPLANFADYLHVVVSQPIVPLLQDQNIIQCISTEVPEESFDHHVSIADLPYLLGSDETPKMPPPFPLSIDSETADKLHQQHLENMPQPWVGLTWRAGAIAGSVAEDVELLHKSIDLALIEELFKDFKGTLVLLQRNPGEGEVEHLREHLKCSCIDLTGANENLQEMAAILFLLDDYIGVSNTNMHIRGSLNLPARLLVPYPPEWRWLESGEDTHWYSTFTLYRQEKNGGWQQALKKIRKDAGFL